MAIASGMSRLKPGLISYKRRKLFAERLRDKRVPKGMRMALGNRRNVGMRG